MISRLATIVVFFAFISLFVFHFIFSTSSQQPQPQPQQQQQQTDQLAPPSVETQIDRTTENTPTPRLRQRQFASSSSLSSSFDEALFGGSSAVLSRRRIQLRNPRRGSSSSSRRSKFVPNDLGADDVNGENSKNDDDDDEGSLPQLPDCPREFKLYLNDTNNDDNNDKNEKKNIDHDPQWILAKYKLYAKRCQKRQGIMWAQLSLQNHDAIAQKVARVIFSSSHLRNSSSFSLFDFGAGCGAGVKFFANYFRGRRFSSSFRALGIDLIPEAIAYARKQIPLHSSEEKAKTEILKFCVADGTNLSFIISDSNNKNNEQHQQQERRRSRRGGVRRIHQTNFQFDAILAFGSLLHVPQPKICSTLAQLFRVTKAKGGLIAALYIDDAETADFIAHGCSDKILSGFYFSERNDKKKEEEEEEEYYGDDSIVNIEMRVVSERVWFRGLFPKANLKRNPMSILWRRVV